MDEYYTYINRKGEQAAIYILTKAEFSIELATDIVQGILDDSKLDDE